MTRRLLCATALTACAVWSLALAGCDLINPPKSPGEKLWRDNCAKCHGIDGSGNTPAYMGNQYADLTDDYWKHGGDVHDIANTIRDGKEAGGSGHVVVHGGCHADLMFRRGREDGRR